MNPEIAKILLIVWFGGIIGGIIVSFIAGGDDK